LEGDEALNPDGCRYNLDVNSILYSVSGGGQRL